MEFIVIIVIIAVVFFIVNIVDTSPKRYKYYKYITPIIGGRDLDTLESNQTVIFQNKFITFSGFHNDKIVIKKTVRNYDNTVYHCMDGHRYECIVIEDRLKRSLFFMNANGRSLRLDEDLNDINDY